MLTNPFYPGNPVSGDNFINRENDLRLILEHTRKGISSAIVGNPHIGKTSLLSRFLEPETLQTIYPDPEKYTVVESDFHLLMGLTPNDFWQDVLESVATSSPHVRGILQSLLEIETINSLQLNQAFRQLGEHDHQVILLIDEFDAMLGLPEFDTNFQATLRSIAQKKRGLVLITASRESIVEMNEHLEGRYENLYGSRLLNYLQNISIGSLPPADVVRWLGEHFESEQIKIIEQLSGRHPYLLQIAGEIVYEAKSRGSLDFAKLHFQFVDRATDQFSDTWSALNARGQIALVIFTLSQLEGELLSGEKFNLKSAEKELIWYSSEINDMVKRGTLETSQSGQVKIGSIPFALWIIENKIVGTRGQEAEKVFEEWLVGKQYKLGKLITQEQLTWLSKTWQKIPRGLIDLAKKALLPEYLQ
ncbi:MAG: ATP-binding protein [Anaerolineae bacterium]|nr:ATP-binding protein [Anaerolineae bacterium]